MEKLPLESIKYRGSDAQGPRSSRIFRLPAGPGGCAIEFYFVFRGHFSILWGQFSFSQTTERPYIFGFYRRALFKTKKRVFSPAEKTGTWINRLMVTPVIPFFSWSLVVLNLTYTAAIHTLKIPADRGGGYSIEKRSFHFLHFFEYRLFSRELCPISCSNSFAFSIIACVSGPLAFNTLRS